MKNLVSQPLRIALALALMAVTISLCYGFQYRISRGQVFSYYLAFSVVFGIILAFATYGLVRRESASPPLGAIHGWCGFLLSLLCFTLTLFFRSKLLAPLPWYVLSAAVALIGSYLHWRWSAKASTW